MDAEVRMKASAGLSYFTVSLLVLIRSFHTCTPCTGLPFMAAEGGCVHLCRHMWRAWLQCASQIMA